MAKISIIGAGSWGTALGLLLCNNGHDVTICSENEKEIESLKEHREHLTKLPGVRLPDEMKFTCDVRGSLSGQDILVMAKASPYVRTTCKKYAADIPDGQLIVNVAKGVEAQTKKLFKVCSDRGIPIFTFVNKIDHFGKNPFDLMADIEDVLGIRSCPMNWPIGVNGDYTGIYDREKRLCHLFVKDNAHGVKKLEVISGRIDDPEIVSHLSEEVLSSLKDDLELLEEAGDPFDKDKVSKGELTPLFFGSAMTNFGVQTFLEKYLELAPPPEERETLEGHVAPEDPAFSAFVFKIQANMDPKHHDRIAFLRICSGIFEKGASVLHRQSGKMLRLSQPQQFLATERQTVEKAYPGDIIGIFDTGELGVGDTVCEKKSPVTFIDFPVFPPELFARLSPESSMKRKQFLNGVSQLAQEGAIQIYKQPYIMESFIIGAVGQLQFEVMKYRLEKEYNVTVNVEPISYTCARWTEGDVPPEELIGLDNAMVVYDRRERPVYLLPNAWQAGWLEERNKDVVFLQSPPLGVARLEGN